MRPQDFSYSRSHNTGRPMQVYNPWQKPQYRLICYSLKTVYFMLNNPGSKINEPAMLPFKSFHRISNFGFENIEH
jgi:hypothetical protein